MLFLKAFNVIREISSSYLLFNKVYADSTKLVSNCNNFGPITVKSILLGRNRLTFIQRRLFHIPLAMTPCSRIEINPTIPVTSRLFVSLQSVRRPQLKNGNLWLKKRKLFCFLPTLASRDFAMSGKFSPLPAK